MSPSSRTTASKQTMQKYIVMTTVEFPLEKPKQSFADFSENKFSINFKRLTGLKITLVKQFTYPKGWAWLFPLCLIILSCPRGRHFKG